MLLPLKVLSWNVRRSNASGKAWDVIEKLDPDLILLQEVIEIPKAISSKYHNLVRKARGKGGGDQKFSTAVLSKGVIIREINLTSKFDWVQRDLDHFQGNLVACQVDLIPSLPLNVISVYSPAWPVDPDRLKDVDVTPVKLKNNPDVWCTELLWSSLKNLSFRESNLLIVAGDFNSSVTFDEMWNDGPRGNQEIIDRMNELGLYDSLFQYQGKLTPTFRNPKGGKVIHQLDYMYLSDRLSSLVKYSRVVDDMNVFEEGISDHLPILTEIKL